MRQWARTGVHEELDLEETIKDTAKNGYLDIKMRKEKENSIKLLLFLDVGGSMDEHIIKVESLFSAAKNVFKNFKHFYFHNCLYEGVWQNNSRRWEERFSTEQILRTYGREYKCIFVGDASMSPYEILMPGGEMNILMKFLVRHGLKKRFINGHHICGLIQFQKNIGKLPIL